MSLNLLSICMRLSKHVLKIKYMLIFLRDLNILNIQYSNSNIKSSKRIPDIIHQSERFRTEKIIFQTICRQMQELYGRVTANASQVYTTANALRMLRLPLD